MKKHLIHDWIETMQGGLPADRLFDKLSAAHPPLISVTFTRKCNLSCKHCVYPKANQDDFRRNDLEMIEEAIEATRKAKVVDLIHVGRTLQKEHLPILQKFQQRGMTLHLIDNGSGAKLVFRMKQMGIYFQGGIDVSIDGDEAAHERQRGSGAWKLAIEGAKKLQQVADHVSITATASSLNYPHITSGFHQIREMIPNIKIFQVTTTSPARHHSERMHLTSEEMLALANDLVTNLRFPATLAIYRVEDIAPLLPLLKRSGKRHQKYISIEWDLGNLTIAFFPQSIVPSEEFAIDANGRHVLPFGLDWHLKDRPEDWEMKNSLILSDPDWSYEKLVRKYINTMGREVLRREKEVFRDFF